MKKQTSLVETLENRTLMAVDVKIDFTRAGVPVQSGYLADTGAVYANRGNGQTYGWSSDNKTPSRDRNSPKSPNQAFDTVNYLRFNGIIKTWEIALPNGDYNVRLVSGDPAYPGRKIAITGEGKTINSGTTSASKPFIDTTTKVTVKDGRLTLGNASGSQSSAVALVEIKSVGATEPTKPESITWPTKWTQKASAPTAVFESHDAVVNGKLYIFGGWTTSNFVASKKVMVYDPAKNTWTSKRDMPAPETHGAFATDSSTGLIYSAGGNRGDIPEVVVADVYRYNPATDTWTSLPALPKALGGATAQVVNGKLHVIGGFASDNSTTTSVHYVLNLSNLSAGWGTAAAMPTARDHSASVVINNKIYVVGGELQHRTGFAHQKLLHVYDPATDTWTRLADAPTGKSHAEGSTFVSNGKIIYAGGQTYPQKPTNEVVQYDPATNKWTTLAPLPSARQGVAVARVGNYFVITTGGVATTQPQKTTWVYQIVM